MIRVYSFSATGRTHKVAQIFADRLGTSVIDLDSTATDFSQGSDTAVIVFPVYCQNVPEPVRSALPKIKADNAVLIATYGKMSHGNAICDAAELVRAAVIAAAYVPIGHTYLAESDIPDITALKPIFDRISTPKKATLIKERKNPLADLFPSWRSRIGVKLSCAESCTKCGTCTQACPMSAISNGVPTARCIRCLRCVSICPNKALKASYDPFLKLYLKKKKQDEIKIYL